MAQDSRRIQRVARHATPQPHRVLTGIARFEMFEGAMPAVLGAALPCAVACPGTVADNRGISQLLFLQVTTCDVFTFPCKVCL